MSSRLYSWNAYETELTSGIGIEDPAILNVVSVFGITAPTILVLDPDVPALREYVLVTSVAPGQLTVSRALDGSTDGAQAHGEGTTLRAIAVHQWLNAIFDDIEGLEDWDQEHVDGSVTNPHGLVYYTKTESENLFLRLDTTNDPLTGELNMGVNKITDIVDAVADQDVPSFIQMKTADALIGSEASDDLQTHIDDAADPHAAADYMKQSEADAAYLKLDGSNSMLDNLNMDSNKLINLGLGTIGTDSIRKSQLDDHAADVNAHHDPYTDAEALAEALDVVTGGIFLATLGAFGQGTLVEVADFNITKPAGWGSVRVVVDVFTQYAGATNTVQLSGRVDIDTDTGNAIVGGTVGTGGDPQLAMVNEAVTADATIDVKAFLSNGQGNGATATARSITGTYSLYRLS